MICFIKMSFAKATYHLELHDLVAVLLDFVASVQLSLLIRRHDVVFVFVFVV